jgi:uncharacterized protein YdbL (DUF1318 family)
VRLRACAYRLALALVTLMTALSILAGGALAQGRALDAPRAQGQVAERYDGYAMVRGNVPASVRNLVNRVNAERRAVYQRQAKSRNVPVDAVGKIYAKEIFANAPRGTWFLQQSGKWTRK